MKTLRAVRILKAAKAYDPHGVYFLMSRLHVGTPDADIRADIMRRTMAWPESETREAMVAYALAVHHRNGRTYRRVVSGKACR